MTNILRVRISLLNQFKILVDKIKNVLEKICSRHQKFEEKLMQAYENDKLKKKKNVEVLQLR